MLLTAMGRSERGGTSVTRAVGLWIDHRKAVIVVVTGQGETTSLILSRVEKQLGRYAGVRSTARYEPQQVPADDRQERRFTAQLATYYDAVVACVGAADAILIVGPGEAKVELKQRLETNRRGGCIIGIETIDKMTDRQIAAKVWRHFSEGAGVEGRRGTAPRQVRR